MSIIVNVQFHVYTVLWFSSSFLLGAFRQKSVHKEQKNCILWTLFCLRGCWAVFFFSKIMIAFLHFCVSEIFFHCSNYLLLMHRFAHVNVVRVKWDQTRKPAITTQTVTRKSNQSELGTLKKKKKFLSLSVDDEQVLSHRLRVHFNSTFQHKGKPSPNAPRLSFGLSAAR